MSFRALPFRILSTAQAPDSSATDLIETYILNSEFHSYLHPDALITPEGIKFSSNGGAIGGPVLRNLRRVAAGLRGEVLEPEEEDEESSEQQHQQNGNGVDGMGFGFGGNGVVKKEEGEEGQNDEWQNMAEYELEQGPVDVAAIGDRSHAVRSGGVQPQVRSTLVTSNHSRKRTNDSREENGEEVDKDARRIAKKARKKEQRRDKEMARVDTVG